MNTWFMDYYDRVMSTTRNNSTWVWAFTEWIKVRKLIRQRAGQV